MATETIATVAPPPPAAAVVLPRPRLWTSTGLRAHVAMILTLGTAVLLAYSNSFIAEFSQETRQLVVDDARVQAVTKANLRTILKTDYGYPRAISGSYRPVTTLSYLFNYVALGSGRNPVGYHWINFFLHWINTALVYFLLLALTGNVWPAFLTAALFAMHPVATEAVTDIAGRAEQLATLGVLAGLLLYARSHLETGMKKMPWLLALTGVATLAAFARENALVLVELMLVLDLVIRLPRWLEEKKPSLFWDVAAGYLAWLPALLLWLLARGSVYAALPAAEISPLDNPLVATDAWTARLTAVKVIGKYLWLLVCPTTLSCDYSFNQIPLATWRFTNWEAVKSLIALAAIIWLVLVAIRFVRRNRPLTCCILFFFVALLPVSNLITLSDRVMVERNLYLPLVGFAGAAVFAVYGLCRVLVVRMQGLRWAPAVWLQFIARTLLLALALLLGIRAWKRNFDWETNLKLWSSAAQAAPDSYKTHRWLAFMMYENDRKTGDERKSIDDVIQEAEKARDITEDDVLTLVHLGHYYKLKGDTVLQRAPDGSVKPDQQLKHWYGKALEALMRAAVLDQRVNTRHHKEQRRLGRKPEEIRDVGNTDIYWNIGAINVQLNNQKDALKAYAYMRHLVPTNPDACLGLASVHLVARDYEQAAIPLLQALILDSTRQEAMQSLVEVFRHVEHGECAIEFSHGQPQLNLDECQVAHDYTCQAYADLIQTLVDAHQPDDAKRARQQAMQTARCSAQQLAPPSNAATMPAPTIP